MQSISRAPLVVSTETAGLGNRIKSWVSAMRLGARARVLWALNENMPAEFRELFANDCAVSELPAGAAEYCSWRLAVLPEDEAFLPVGFATVGAGAHPLIRRSARADARHIDLEYGRIPQHFRDVYVPLFRSVVVQPSIAARVADFAACLDDDVIGVQIRTWRDDPRRYRKYHLPSVRRLARLLDAAPATSRFLVVSDADEIIGELAGRYGARRVLQFPRATPRSDSWRAPEGVREDLIDMLLLARTRRLYASYLSTFSEAAWWLGGARADVDVF